MRMSFVRCFLNFNLRRCFQKSSDKCNESKKHRKRRNKKGHMKRRRKRKSKVNNENIASTVATADGAERRHLFTDWRSSQVQTLVTNVPKEVSDLMLNPGYTSLQINDENWQKKIY
ncbi:hypothetical protein NPIL_369801 [Nephila pilipes]|uniref:Uncharacterized protein n=1 Tax=Nephila pilipes TaxID=299642 RepID=A0A8X6QXH8_NEPPI|nr:hypothetical protein NPIL_369801 [Nephila pilipes]